METQVTLITKLNGSLWAKYTAISLLAMLVACVVAVIIGFGYGLIGGFLAGTSGNKGILDFAVLLSTLTGFILGLAIPIKFMVGRWFGCHRLVIQVRPEPANNYMETYAPVGPEVKTYTPTGTGMNPDAHTTRIS